MRRDNHIIIIDSFDTDSSGNIKFDIPLVLDKKLQNGVVVVEYAPLDIYECAITGKYEDNDIKDDVIGYLKWLWDSIVTESDDNLAKSARDVKYNMLSMVADNYQQLNKKENSYVQ